MIRWLARLGFGINQGEQRVDVFRRFVSDSGGCVDQDATERPHRPRHPHTLFFGCGFEAPGSGSPATRCFSLRLLPDFCRLSAAIAAILLLCDCRRPTATPSPTPSNTATKTPSPPSTLTPTPTLTPLPSPSQSVQPSLSPVPSAFPIAEVRPTPSPDPFEVNLQRLLQASENGFRDLRGKLKKTEKGSDSAPLFRIRKTYEGTFLFDGSSSAELEEVYFHAGQQPTYNYRVSFQALSARESIERYDQFRANLNYALKEFEHTFGDRYDAWASHGALQTAVLLNESDTSGSPEIQMHVAFSAPQW
jgi:hypothetical protein